MSKTQNNQRSLVELLEEIGQRAVPLQETGDKTLHDLVACRVLVLLQELGRLD